MEIFDKPHVIDGGVFTNKTGKLSFVNDFRLDEITRFYIIEQNIVDEAKAWQGHKLEEKFFMCINGRFKIYAVKIDDWSNPSAKLIPMEFEVNIGKPQVLCIPKGYANGIKALDDNSKLISFSKLKLENSVEEKIRFDKNLWVNWNNIEI